MTVVRRTAHRAAIAGLVSALAATATTAIVVVSPPGHAGRPQPPRAHVWVTTPDGAERLHERGTVAFAPGAAATDDDHGRPELALPDDGRVRGVDHRLVGVSAVRSSTRPTRDATMRACSSPTGCRSCASRSARPTSSTARTTPSTTCPPGRPTTSSTTSPSSTTRPQILPLLRQALAAQPRPQGDGDAVEPAGLDEDQRLAGRRPADRRPAGSTRRTPTTWSSSCRRTRRPACRSGASPSRTSRRTAPPRLPRHRPADPPGDPGDRPARPGAGRGRPAHQDPRLRPQLVRASRTTSPTRRPGRTRRRSTPPCCSQSRPPSGSRHGVPLLRRRPEAETDAAPRRSRTRGSGSPSAPARTGRATRRPRSSATP